MHPDKADYDLVAHLRALRSDGDEAMTAAEKYDQYFSLKLAACMDAAEAEVLLIGWLQRRVDTLTRTQAELRQAWQHAHSD
jgi:hypothetical protein